jgi:TolB-like protein/Tfp pilus assembly protein PilF
MAAPSQLVGQTLGHYRILEQIGSGGMGVVYLARDEQLERDVAVKVLPVGVLSDETARKRFRREALTLAKLNHPNVETVYEFGSSDGTDFLVTEYIRGTTLDAKLAGGTLLEKEVVQLSMQLAAGLAAAHQQGVVHRDVKPSNLRVTPDGLLKILDFGLARLSVPEPAMAQMASLTQSQEIAGTLPYMAPEQLRGEKTDARSDIWAAGAVLYELATGKRPFEAKASSALAADIIHKPPLTPRQIKPNLSPELEGIILKCLDKEPENRYQSAKELGVDLRRLSMSTTGAVIAAAPRVKTGWMWALAPMVVVATLALLFAFNLGGWRERVLGGGAPQIRSLVVLPLENFSRDPDQEYFAEGMTEALITDLSKIGALRVISRTSAMHYKRTTKTLPEIARELGVDGVIEGSVLRAGNRVRITAQLIAAPSDRHVWAESYDRELRDVLDLQAGVAQAIAEEVRAKVTSEEHALLTQRRPVNHEAYEAYLKGRYFWNRRTPEALAQATELFQQAIGIDPSFALAYVGLADSYISSGIIAGVRPEDIYPKARAAASRALEIDQTLAEAHSSLGIEKDFYEWDWAAAEAEHKRAIELSPNYATAHQWYGVHLGIQGRIPEGMTELRKAQELDPLSLIINTNIGQFLLFAGDYDHASEQFRKTLEMDPNFIFARINFGLVLMKKGLYDDAVVQFQTAAKQSGNRMPWALGNLASAYAKAGKRADAVKILSEMHQLAKQRYVPPLAIAAGYLGLGDNKRVLDLLDEALKDRSAGGFFLKLSPGYDPLRSDPRFRNALRTMGLPQ